MKKTLIATIFFILCNCSDSHNKTNIAIYESEFRIHHGFATTKEAESKQKYIISKIATKQHSPSIFREDSWMIFTSRNAESIQFYFDYWELHEILKSISVGDEILITKNGQNILYIEIPKLKTINFRRLKPPVIPMGR